MAALLHSLISSSQEPPVQPPRQSQVPVTPSHVLVLAVTQLQVCVQLSPQLPSGHTENQKQINTEKHKKKHKKFQDRYGGGGKKYPQFC